MKLGEILADSRVLHRRSLGNRGEGLVRAGNAIWRTFAAEQGRRRTNPMPRQTENTRHRRAGSDADLTPLTPGRVQFLPVLLGTREKHEHRAETRN